MLCCSGPSEGLTLWRTFIKDIYNFHKVKIPQGRRERCEPINWSLGQSPRSFVVVGHYSNPNDLKLMELPVEKKILERILLTKPFIIYFNKKTKAGHINMKVIGGTCSP